MRVVVVVVFYVPTNTYRMRDEAQCETGRKKGLKGKKKKEMGREGKVSE